MPSVLLSGHRANILKWRHEQALIQTAKKRPELLSELALTDEDLSIITKYMGDLDKEKH